MMKRIPVLLTVLLSFQLSLAQTTENFDDGDFSDGNPLTWIASQTSGGDDFVVTSGEVQSNGPAASGDLYLSTNLEIDFANNDVVWTFKIRYENGSTAPSGSNRVELYLISDIEDVTGSPQGYYIRMGETGSADGIDLFKTNSGTAIINDASDLVGSGINVHIRVTRTSVGMWTVEADASGGDTFSTIGSVTDTDFTSGDYFGLYVDHTSTHFNDFFLDDVTVTLTPLADTNPPTIETVTAISATEVDVLFNEKVDQTIAETGTNYNIEGGISITSATRDVTNNALVHLTTSSMTNGTNYTIIINNIEDENGNVIVASSQKMFQYLVFEEAVEFDVVINEFMADPNPVIGLPDAEFVELYNRSSKFLQLENWKLDGQVLGSFTFNPDSYVIICEDDDLALFSAFANALAVTTLTLSNSSSDVITLEDDNAVQIHSVSFEGSSGGISTELINPNSPDYSKNNYGLSTDPDGGTPGEENSIFDDTPDTTKPTISSISVVSPTELDVTFDEPVDETSSEVLGNYIIDGGISVSIVMRDDTDNSIVHLTVSTLVSGNTRTLTINGVEDLSGNVIVANSIINFEYVETEEVEVGDVLINEFYAIPSSESAIPNIEFVELLNVSDKFIDMQNWTLSDASNSSSGFSSFILRPAAYVILTETDNGVLFASYGDVVEVQGFPALNNGGDEITITSGSATEIYSITYGSGVSGITTELINPEGPDFSENNYGFSIDPDGGTPGEQNSIFDDTPDTTPPLIADFAVVSSTGLKVIFNEPVTTASAQAISNYSIDGGVSVTSAQFEAGSQTIINLVVSELVSTENRLLTINNVLDLSGNAIAVDTKVPFVFIATVDALPGDVLVNEFMANPLNEGGSTNGEFIELLNNTQDHFELESWTVSDASGSSGDLPAKILGPGELIILVPDYNPEIFDGLGEVLVVPGFRSLNNSSDDIILSNAIGTIIFELSYTQSELGKSAELVNPDDPCISEHSYATSTATEGSTPGQINSVFDKAPDTMAPRINSSNFDQYLTINFSETMDAMSLINGTYGISGLTISNISTGQFPMSVDLFFAENLDEGVIYEMSISNVSDCWGNLIGETMVNFGIGRSPGFNELLITEIMSDPDPSAGLPEVEFVEIYNNTSEIITTKNLRFSDALTSSILPSISIFPFEYYVLTSPSNVNEFSSAKVMGVSGFPSLSNAGEQLYLSREDELIFSVNYSSDWHEEERVDGGYSLEMKDLLSPCVEEFNWGSSVNQTGGTPGSPNSLSQSIPDNFGPHITEASVLSPDQLRIDFDENIDPATIVSGSILFEPALGIASIDFNLLFPKSIFVSLSENLVENTPHTFQLSTISDCNGNVVQENNLVVVLPSVSVFGDILLSEVLFNPRSNGVDFVEVYNASAKYLDLNQWKIARITAHGISDEKSIPSTSVISPGNYSAFTPNVEILFNNYPKGMVENFQEIASLPPYSNDTGNVVILNHLGEVEQLFHYEDDFHYDLLESDDGVSLERISFNAEVNDPNNWRSASSVAGFATPGKANSQALAGQSVAAGTVEAEPKVFIPGNAGSGRDFTTINYRFDQPGKFANITVYDQTGRLIKNVAEGALLSTFGFVRWDGTTNTGEIARLGYYVVLFEVFDSNGNSDIIKETVVVGRDF